MLKDIEKPIQKIRSSSAWVSFIEQTPNPLIINTPLVKSDLLARASGIDEVYFKAEYLQLGNSFKIRGAIHKLQSLLSLSQKPIVYTASAGNHGIGLALAAKALGFKAVIYVPENTPQIKQEKILATGAILKAEGSNFDESEFLAKTHCDKTKGEYISSFDDDYIIAGNGGSIAREIYQALNENIENMDLIVPIGGGGMASGLVTFFHGSCLRLLGVEPENDCAMYHSVKNQRFQKDYIGQGSYADGLAGAISQHTFNLCSTGLQQVLTVSESEILQATCWAYEQLGIVIEGSSAVTIAALLNKKIQFSPRVCLILTGSNIDQSLITKARSFKHTLPI
ncbi:threonine/serine dehydratase [Marinomonas sp. THO17]|uniref:threonine ammonia-lyase n=1 Tax=Marinomonas sp. THO17 TaxID=3149048 RepID=UPI00336C2831